MNRIRTFMYVSYISIKKFFIPSSFLLSCTIINLMWLAVTKADTNHWLNLSTHLRYILLLFHMCSSTKSRAACAMNWLRCLWSSFWNLKNGVLLPKQVRNAQCCGTKLSAWLTLNFCAKVHSMVTKYKNNDASHIWKQ